MTKLSIITRAFNRLEYTVQCVSAVQLNTNIDYEHIIINNGSSDGTKEWLEWIHEMPNNWYSNVKAVHCDNQGDWGGMVHAIEHLSEDSEFMMQLDNDMIVPPNWAEICLEVMEKYPADVIMMKRSGFTTPLKISNVKQIQMSNGTQIECGTIPTAVSCWIARTEIFKKTARGHESCRAFTTSCGKVAKILDLVCASVEGFGLVENYEGECLQREKYQPADRRTRRYLKKKQKNDARKWREQQGLE